MKVIILKDERYPEYYLEAKNFRGLEPIEVSEEFYREFLDIYTRWCIIQDTISHMVP